jgi:hypothetical protein
MKTIYIGFSCSGKIGSKLISWFMRKPFSHTYLKFQEPWYKDQTIHQATGHGLGYMSENIFNSECTVVKEFPLQISDELFLEVVTNCHNNSGANYGYFQLLGIFMVDVLSKIGIKIKKNPIRGGIICSEWMYDILTEVYGKWTDKDPNLVDPSDIYAFLMTKV